jgi:hypothetical protein
MRGCNSISIESKQIDTDDADSFQDSTLLYV